MVTSYIEHYTANNLSRHRWGKYMLSISDDNSISLDDKRYAPVIAQEIWLYGNESDGNILARIFDERDEVDKYALLTTSTNQVKWLRDISREVYDGKYRITRDFNDRENRKTVAIIRESDGNAVTNPHQWKDITDINNNIAIIEFKEGAFALQNLDKVNIDLIGEAGGICEISHVVGYLYKYKKIGISGYFLYNAQTKRDSGINRHCPTFKEVEKVSDEMVMATNVNDDKDVCFISVNAGNFHKYIGVAEASQLHIDKDNKIISFHGWYGDDYDESDVAMNFNGSRLNQKEGTKTSTDEIVRKYNQQHPNQYISSSPTAETLPNEDNEGTDEDEVSIVRCWVYTGEPISNDNGRISFDNSFGTKRLKEGSLVAWVLPSVGKFVVGSVNGDGFLQNKIGVVYQSGLEEGLLLSAASINFGKGENSIRLNGVWRGRKSEIQGKILESLNQFIEKRNNKKANHKETSMVVKEDVDEPVVSHQSKQVDDHEKESLLLKEVFLFLQSKGFNSENILNSISALFPGFEHRLLDANNDVRVNNPDLFKEINKYTEYRNNRNDLAFIKSKLNLSDKQKEQLQFCLMVKGNTFAEALRSVDSSGKASKAYSEIMDSNNLLDKCWKQVGQLIIDEIVAYQMEPTEEYRQEVEQELSKPKKKYDGKVCIPLKDSSMECSLDEIVNYTVFLPNRKMTYSFDTLKYTKIGHNIFLFLDKERADEIDKEGKPVISGIPGEGKVGDQTIGKNNINSDLYNQQERGIHVLVFARYDDESCRFFDEFDVLKVEENTSAREIKCTFKSMYRFQ